jgi:hypothetical protein
MENWPGNWDPPVWGPVLQSHVPWNEEINKIIATVGHYITDGESLEKCGEFVVKKFDEAFARFVARQPIVERQIKDFELEMSSKLTSDQLVTGFSKTVTDHLSLIQDGVKT